MRSETTKRWAVILAGGNGMRLGPLTRLIAGDERPKQFCTILGGETLLDQTRRRVSLAVPPEQTMFVVTQTHERFYVPLLGGVSPDHVIAQPKNQGTAPAIVYSLLRLATMAPAASVAFFPSDHYFSNDEKFMSHVDSAFEAADFCPELVTLLGITADSPEVEYGWIEPAEPILGHGPSPLFRVRRFWEKPPLVLARKLMERRCLWNSFVMVGHVTTFLEMIRRAVPHVYYRFKSVRSKLNTDGEEWGIRALYDQLPSTNFSQQVLAVRPADLAVLPVSEVGWSDWGEPDRVLSDLEKMGQDVGWQRRRDDTLSVHRLRNWRIPTQP
jgi:mannose-1-phosphate guanylyltransferase